MEKEEKGINTLDIFRKRAFISWRWVLFVLLTLGMFGGSFFLLDYSPYGEG